jgi:hypothetical protein
MLITLTELHLKVGVLLTTINTRKQKNRLMPAFAQSRPPDLSLTGKRVIARKNLPSHCVNSVYGRAMSCYHGALLKVLV